jgi:hypothetical protein
MKIYENGIYRDLTPEELAQMEAEARLYNIEQSRRPLTESEVLALLIPTQINTLSVDDNTALRMKDFYPEWTADTAYSVGFKVQYNGKLWRCLSAHTSNATWYPSTDTASLWEQINETHSGTIDDPIPYDGNMALESGKHYMQDGVIYLCSRDTVNPVYSPLSELVGLYVEVV